MEATLQLVARSSFYSPSRRAVCSNLLLALFSFTMPVFASHRWGQISRVIVDHGTLDDGKWVVKLMRDKLEITRASAARAVNTRES